MTYSLANSVKLVNNRIPLDIMPEELIGGKRLMLMSIRRTEGVWTIAGLSPNKPVFINFPPKKSLFDIVDGSEESLAFKNEGGSWEAGAVNSRSIIIIPETTTVTLLFYIVGGTVKAYQ